LFGIHPGTLEMITAMSRDFQARLDHWKETGEIAYYTPTDGERWPTSRGEYPVQEQAVQLDTSAELLAKKILSANATIKQAEADKESAEKELKEIMGQATKASAGLYDISWPIRSYKAQPEKVVPAKDAYTIRQSTLTIKSKGIK
jgi:hypothetical protein